MASFVSMPTEDNLAVYPLEILLPERAGINYYRRYFSKANKEGHGTTLTKPRTPHQDAKISFSANMGRWKTHWDAK